MSSQSTSSAAFILSLIGGIVIIIGGAVEALFLSFGHYNGTYYGMGPGMMSGYGFYGYGSGWMTALSLIAIVFGIIVLIGAVMLNSRPAENVTWGIIVLVFSIASLVGMGGYFIGAILGIAGGAIALSYKSSSSEKKA